MSFFRRSFLSHFKQGVDMTIPLLDIILTCLGLYTLSKARSQDTTSWWTILVYPLYWCGGLALGHLIIVLGLKPLLTLMFENTEWATTLFFGCSVCWGGLLVLFTKRLPD